MRFWKFALPLLGTTLCFAAQPDRITGPIDSSRMVALSGHVNPNAKPQYDQGAVEPLFQLNHVTLLTLPTPSQQKALSLLVAEQQDPTSPNYHKWIAPEQYADRFGLSQNDVRKISAWLTSQGLSVVSVARGRNWIVFSGTAAQVESAFRIQIHRYNVNGERHFAPATMPSIPAALSGITTGIRGLDNFRPRPAYVKAGARRSPNYYASEFQIPDVVAPGDIATIYDLTPLYSTGINGAGQKLVIVGETDVYLDDLNAFRAGFGLPSISGCTTNASGVITACDSSNFQYILNGADPGVSLYDLTEADLDLEWSAATAPGAKLIFVNTAISTDVNGGGVFDSYYYAIDNDLAPVISMSYGAPCEFFDNNLPNDEIELTKANTLGITFMNSSGDSGAASCDGSTNPSTNNLAVGGLAVSYPASSPEVTAVGGTAIAYPQGFDTTYWSTTIGVNGGTAQNPPLPESSWNDDVELGAAYDAGAPLEVQETYAIVSSGGGASNCSVQTSDFSNCVSGFPQPSWQTVTISGQTTRLLPDVSLLASPNFPGYIYCTPVEELSSASPYDTETTSSCGTGSASDIATAVNGVCSGACNGDNTLVDPSLVGGTSASSPIFAGIVTLLNQYLGSNGLGNINPTLYTLAKTTSNGAFHQINSGNNIVYCEVGQPPTPWPVALQCPGAGYFGYDASNSDPTTGYNLVTGLGSVDADKLLIAWEGSSTAPNFTLMAGTASPASVSAGQSAAVALTVTPMNGSTQTINFTPSSCTGQPAGVTCSFNPASITLDGTDSQTVTLTLATAANMAIPTGVQTITVKGTTSGTGSTSHTANVSLTVTATTESFTLMTTAQTFTVPIGASQQVPITVNPTNGFIVGSGPGATTALPLTYSCSGSPSLPAAEISCTLSPAGLGQPTNATTVTIDLATTPPTTQLRPPFGGSRIFYALLLPGLFGVVFAAGSRPRGLRLLSLIVVLGFSTLWLGSCGGNNSTTTPNNPGTPANSYTVTVNATTGGANPLTNSTTFTLVVQAQ